MKPHKMRHLIRRGVSLFLMGWCLVGLGVVAQGDLIKFAEWVLVAFFGFLLQKLYEPSPIINTNEVPVKIEPEPPTTQIAPRIPLARTKPVRQPDNRNLNEWLWKELDLSEDFRC